MHLHIQLLTMMSINRCAMVRPVKRRHSSVIQTKHLIDAIKSIRYQKQIPNVERINKYMNREFGLRQSETEKHLHYAVKDGVIISYTAVGKKGSMTGIEQEGFRIPEEEDELVKWSICIWKCMGLP